MMDEKVLLQAIGSMMDEKLKPIQQNISAISGRLDGLKSGQQAANKRLDGLESGQQAANKRLDGLDRKVSVLQNDVSIMESDIAQLKEDSKVNRSAANILLDWADRAEVEINVPLLHKEKQK